MPPCHGCWLICCWLANVKCMGEARLAMCRCGRACEIVAALVSAPSEHLVRGPCTASSARRDRSSLDVIVLACPLYLDMTRKGSNPSVRQLNVRACERARSTRDGHDNQIAGSLPTCPQAPSDDDYSHSRSWMGFARKPRTTYVLLAGRCAHQSVVAIWLPIHSPLLAAVRSGTYGMKDAARLVTTELAGCARGTSPDDALLVRITQAFQVRKGRLVRSQTSLMFGTCAGVNENCAASAPWSSVRSRRHAR
jgi:hypothetical protein